ncbi:MAG: hypothetical protein H6620_11935 [Halobacteriovoraceae bacterium]|nr:hypothetical protein [Halobacteriovoraceae bacterium]
MSAINFARKGLGLLWESVTTKGVSLTETTSSVGKKMVKQSGSSSHAPSMQDRRVHSFGFSSPSKLSNVRYYSTSQGRRRDPSLLTTYASLPNPQKIQTLTYNGLRMVGANVPFKTKVSETDLQKAWESARSLNPQFPKFTPDQPSSNFVTLIEHFSPFDPKVQGNLVVEDVDEAILLESFSQNPANMMHVPYGVPHTEDSEIGKKLLAEHIQPEAFILEDGCSNGQHLVSFVSALEEQDVPVRAVGTDVIPYNTNMGRMLVSSMGMDGSVSFSAAHALHRSPPRTISGTTGQHVILGYRLIPVFSEQKILRYMEKISSEMQPGDLWCGSIALPEGQFYERNSSDQQAIGHYSIRPVPTSFGGTTFVHHPDFGEVTDTQLSQHFNRSFEGVGLQLKEGDFSNVVLNTFMTREQLEVLAQKYSLQLAADPIEVDCGDNKRLVVLLKKS